MSYCKRDGDHVSVFVTQEDLAKPDVVSALAEEDEFGVILPNGEINWDCPCLGGMPNGPCGQEFKDAFSCFHYSTAEEKGSDCLETFKRMQECFQKHPDLYKDYEDEEVGEEVVMSEEESGLQNNDTLSVDTSISEESVSSTGSKQLIGSSVS